MPYARIQDGRVAEIAPDAGAPLAERFAPQVAAAFVSCADQVREGWVYDGRAFAPYVPPPPTPAQVAAYAEGRHAAVLDVGGGTIANVASNVNGRGLVDGCIGLANLAVQLGQPAPTFPWVNNDVSTLTLSVAQMQTIALKLGQFVQACYSVLGHTAFAGSMTQGSPLTKKSNPLG